MACDKAEVSLPKPESVTLDVWSRRPLRCPAQRGGVLGSLITALIVGGICGWLASIVMKTNAQMGIIANVVVGIVGGVIGSWLSGVLGLGRYGTLGRLGMIVVGAIALIAILKALKVYK